MCKGLWLLLFTIALVSAGMYAPAALAADDDGGGPAFAAQDSADVLTRLGARFVVTFIKSRTTDTIRTATVVSVTNQHKAACDIAVGWFRGFEPTTAVCTTTMSVDGGVQTDFCSRTIPDALTTCNATCAPDLTFHEGKAEVHSQCLHLAVSARVYYTTGGTDSAVTAISDSKIVRFGEGNLGD